MKNIILIRSHLISKFISAQFTSINFLQQLWLLLLIMIITLRPETLRTQAKTICIFPKFSQYSFFVVFFVRLLVQFGSINFVLQFSSGYENIFTSELTAISLVRLLVLVNKNITDRSAEISLRLNLGKCEIVLDNPEDSSQLLNCIMKVSEQDMTLLGAGPFSQRRSYRIKNCAAGENMRTSVRFHFTRCISPQPVLGSNS